VSWVTSRTGSGRSNRRWWGEVAKGTVFTRIESLENQMSELRDGLRRLEEKLDSVGNRTSSKMNQLIFAVLTAAFMIVVAAMTALFALPH
jgi:hypothetical protein